MNWKAILSNPAFVAVSSAVGGAVIDALYDELTTGHLDLSRKGLEKLGTIALTTLVTALWHLYQPKPNSQATPAKESQ